MASGSTPHRSSRNISANFDGDGKMTIKPQELNIVWGNDNRYWNVPDTQGSPAELYQVCWLEVTGSVDVTKPDKNYEVGFNVSLNPDAFGWGRYPIYIMIKKGKEGKIAWTKIWIDPNRKEPFDITGKWQKPEGPVQDDGKLHFGLYEVWSGKWKGGLKIHGAFIRQLP